MIRFLGRLCIDIIRLIFYILKGIFRIAFNIFISIFISILIFTLVRGYMGDSSLLDKVADNKYIENFLKNDYIQKLVKNDYIKSLLESSLPSLGVKQKLDDNREYIKNDEGFIYYDNTIDSKYLDIVFKFFDDNEYIKKSVIESGCKVVLTSNPDISEEFNKLNSGIGEIQGSANAVGMYEHMTKTIIMNVSEENSIASQNIRVLHPSTIVNKNEFKDRLDNYNLSVLTHEITHFLDFNYPGGPISESEEFKNTFNNEKDMIFSKSYQDYYKTESKEYLAQLGSLFISNVNDSDKVDISNLKDTQSYKIVNKLIEYYKSKN